MGAAKVRIRVPAGGDQKLAIDMTVDQTDLVNYTNVFPAKEWSITDDMMNLSDSASVSIANDNGEHSGKFRLGQKIIIDESDPDVANGQWMRHFTGRITSIETYSDIGGGSNIMLAAMDLGWHLTSSHGKPLVNIKNVTFGKLVDLLIDPSWGFAKTEASNVQNKLLKHGRQLIQQQLKIIAGQILPLIQVEPGQSPFDILRTYAAREGVLINVSSKGGLVFFRPDYTEQALYRLEYHSPSDEASQHRGVAPIGRPSLREQIDGLYSEVQCWSTLISPPIKDTADPNATYTHTTYRPNLDPKLPADSRKNPLPFERRHVFSDSEAINKKLRENRAIWKFQTDAFNSWEYSCEFPSHSQQGGFFVSDTMISINDTVNKLPKGNYYIQSVRRSLTLRDGFRSKLTIRKPWLLNPELTTIGGGAKNAAKPQKAVA